MHQPIARAKRDSLLEEHLKELRNGLLWHAHHVEEPEHPEGLKAEHRAQWVGKGSLVALPHVVLH